MKVYSIIALVILLVVPTFQVTRQNDTCSGAVVSLEMIPANYTSPKVLDTTLIRNNEIIFRHHWETNNTIRIDYSFNAELDDLMECRLLVGDIMHYESVVFKQCSDRTRIFRFLPDIRKVA